MSMKTPFRICILAGVSSVALAAVVVTVSTTAVHADAPLARMAPNAPSAPQIENPTPASPTPQNSPRVRRGTRLHGIASWYGSVFHGRKTASGERFNMFAMTACHPTLPFGTVVRVVNKDNKRSVVVRITDRGDLVDEGRIIDLSYAAAQKLAMAKDGLAKVDLQVLSLGQAKGNK